MGCNQSETLEELENKNEDKKKNNKKEKNSSEEEEKSNNNDEGNIILDNKENGNKNKQNNNKTEKDLLEYKQTKKKNGEIFTSMDDNKELSNIMTEGVTSENRKLNLHKTNYEGVVLMKGVEESIPEELNEDDIYQLVEAALYDKLVEDKDQEEGKITKKQAKAIASILYNKINKCDGKKNSSDKINLKNYPELKGMNIKIEAKKLTKDIIRNMMFLNKKVDECQIDLTYANLTRDNEDIKALTIEIN